MNKARGGTEICALHPGSGKLEKLTQSDPPVWDFRCSESPDGKQVTFCRAPTGASPAIYVLDARKPGKETRLSDGFEARGADHPRWVPPRRHQ